MAAVFSIPPYPGATGYVVSYSDPTVGDPQAPNRFGPWNTLSGSPLTQPSSILDAAGDQNLRLYRVAPVVTVNATSVTFPAYEPFNVGMSEPGVYQRKLYDPFITMMLPEFRGYVSDNGVAQTASTSFDADTGAGSGLLIPDGTKTVFNLADMPDAVPVTVLEASVSVKKNGTTLAPNVDYYVVYEDGQVVFAAAPGTNDHLDIAFREVRYTNRMLNVALANALERLAGLGINGYGVTYDFNVTKAVAPILDTGLRTIVFAAAARIMNQAMIWVKAANARAYKTDGFEMQLPARLLEGMSAQSQIDFSDMKDMVDKYIRTATGPIVYGSYDSFFNTNGLLPAMTLLFIGQPYAYFL